MQLSEGKVGNGTGIDVGTGVGIGDGTGVGAGLGEGVCAGPSSTQHRAGQLALT
jgi:hypothetical protein